jgi:hypothetical protein
LFDDYISCDNDDVMCEAQTVEQMMDETSVSEGEKEGGGGKSEFPATFLLALEGIDTEEVAHEV